MRVLGVCSANQCRSPMLAGLLATRLGNLGVSAHVESAGFAAAGVPALDDAAAAMRGAGIDISGHVSRQVTAGDVEAADLVVGMTRQHVMDLVLLSPTSWPRIFSLIDLVRRAEAVGPIEPGLPFDRWLGRIHAGRERADIVRMRSVDEISDPSGGPRVGYERTRDQLDDLVCRLAVLLVPLAGAPDPRPTPVARRV
jgi:protein-tyrosine phosphatase